MAELKSCPFCGARENDEDFPLAVGWCIETDTCAVLCDRCGASGAERDSNEEAIEAWNRREKMEIKGWNNDIISRNGAIKALYRFCEKNDTENPHIDALVDDVLGNLPEARPAMYGWWIPVTERLPEKKGEYIVAYHPCYWDSVQENKICVGVDTFKGKTSWAKNKFQRVTHWMEKPGPPKGE